MPPASCPRGDAAARHARVRDPDRRAGPSPRKTRASPSGQRRVGRCHRRRVTRWRSLAQRGGHLLRARLRRRDRRASTAAGRRDVRVVCVVTGHGLKDTGRLSTDEPPGSRSVRPHDRQPRPRLRLRRRRARPLERARASRRGRRARSTATHLGVRAHSRCLRPAGRLELPLHRPHPARARPRLERRGRRARPRRREPPPGEPEPRPTSCSRSGSSSRATRDNLAAALAGGVCLTWSDADRADRRRRAPPTPIAVVPEARVETRRRRAPRCRRRSRTRTPPSRAGRAALLGAALASGSAELFAAALDDRLHEPYRADDAPLLAELREQPAAGARRRDAVRRRARR